MSEINRVELRVHLNEGLDIAEVWENGKLLAEDVRCYEVTPNWILIYETIEGKDGPQRGNLRRKISIANCEFIKMEVVDEGS